MPASEREYAARTDLRQDPRVPDELKEDTDLDNSHLGSPWLEYQLGTTSGSSTRYHVQPATESGCIDEQPSGLSAGTCVDQGSLGRNQRYNRNQVNSLISDLDRANLYTMYTQELENDMELLPKVFITMQNQLVTVCSTHDQFTTFYRCCRRILQPAW